MTDKFKILKTDNHVLMSSKDDKKKTKLFKCQFIRKLVRDNKVKDFGWNFASTEARDTFEAWLKAQEEFEAMKANKGSELPRVAAVETVVAEKDDIKVAGAETSDVKGDAPDADNPVGGGFESILDDDAEKPVGDEELDD